MHVKGFALRLSIDGALIIHTRFGDRHLTKRLCPSLMDRKKRAALQGGHGAVLPSSVGSVGILKGRGLTEHKPGPNAIR